MEANAAVMASEDYNRACPGCFNRLVYSDGSSLYPLSCDGAGHVGPKSIKNSRRYSCLSCGR